MYLGEGASSGAANRGGKGAGSSRRRAHASEVAAVDVDVDVAVAVAADVVGGGVLCHLKGRQASAADNLEWPCVPPTETPAPPSAFGEL